MSSSPPSPTSSSIKTTTTNMTGISLGLPRITALLKALHSPHLSTPIIHISGTNGKGSTSAYLSSILLASKFHIARFNSPHLVDEWDCIQIDGKSVEQSVFMKAKMHVEDVDQEKGIGASSFELLTATAFEIFSKIRPKLDLSIIEVGMGGLTDATNVVTSEKTLLSIITAVELDHQKFLGDTLEEIAAVKAGIIKEGVEVIVARQDHEKVNEVVRTTANTMSSQAYFAGEGVLMDPSLPTSSSSSPLVSLSVSPVFSYPKLSPPLPTSSPILTHLALPGSYQLSNSATAVLAAQILRTSPRIFSLLPDLSRITDLAVASGISTTKWPGRLSWIEVPLPSSADLHHSSNASKAVKILLDGAHNPSSAIQLNSYLHSLPLEEQPTTLIIGLSFPRPPVSILEPLLAPSSPASSASSTTAKSSSTSVPSSINKIICVPFLPPPSMSWIAPTPPIDIANAVKSFKTDLIPMKVDIKSNVEEALRSVEQGEKVVVAGSLYLVADVYRLCRAGGVEI